MNFKLSWIIILLVLGASCKSPDPISVKATEICGDSTLYKGKLVVTEGVIGVYDQFTQYYGSSSVSMRLIADEAVSNRIPTLKFRTWGDPQNRMEELPDNFTLEDVKIYDNEGNIIQLGERVRVTGEISGGSNAWCDLSVEKIEKISQ